MGKASSAKKVARAATTGGGRTSQGARPWGWYSALAVVVIVGAFLVVSSRNERLSADNPVTADKPRAAAPDRNFPGDHWHAAYGIYLCDRFAPDIQTDRDPSGIHTHNDGIIHIHPFTRAVSGSKATFGVFAETVGLSVSEDEVKVGDKTYKNGDKCGDKEGRLQVLLNGKERPGDPKDIRLQDRDQLVIAFAPRDDAKVPENPPSAANLDNLNDVEGSPGATSSTTQAPNPEGTTAPPEEPSAPAPPGAEPSPTPPPSTSAPPPAP
ncbi:MAG: hypothetical protein M3N28_07365 [Actinomycetota bacterium]|nr:hypothetical protein [Actinomycetota bacterium]